MAFFTLNFERWRTLPGWLLAGCLLPLALLLGWLLLARVDFLYPVWYRILAIEDHIAHYAPQNRQGRADFAVTTPAEHRRLFGLIARAIQGQDEPLAEAVYHDATGQELGKFLRAEEVGHLKDVERLVAALTAAGWWFTAAALLLGLLLWWRRLSLPPPGGVALAWLLLLGAGGLLLWWQGPQEIFDRLHEWVFPPDYPWFFYYQDSLMTTTMKAPQIFAAIAALWTALALLFYALLYAGARRLLARSQPSEASKKISAYQAAQNAVPGKRLIKRTADEGGSGKPEKPTRARQQKKKSRARRGRRA